VGLGGARKKLTLGLRGDVPWVGEIPLGVCPTITEEMVENPRIQKKSVVNERIKKSSCQLCGGLLPSFRQPVAGTNGAGGRSSGWRIARLIQESPSCIVGSHSLHGKLKNRKQLKN